MDSWKGSFPCLECGEDELLEVSFLEEKIRRELMGVDGNKATRPDRFIFTFAQAFWPIFKRELIMFLKTFFESAMFDHRFSSLFIY